MVSKPLVDYIKILSQKDKKTLSQKALKTCEEVGELAKAILPFDSAHCTNHRFVDRTKILEEIADVHLTNISIAYSLGYTDEEIEDMISFKSKKWGELQSKEEKASFPLPYEIHITIDGDMDNIDKFKEDCKSIGVKPIVIDLELSNDKELKDVMTSSKCIGDNRSAYEESERISNELSGLGYKVLRKKIESVPWHPSAPIENNSMPKNCYYESHIGVIIEKEQKNNLKELVELIGSEIGESPRLSRNFFKKTNDGKFVNMITYRSYKTSYDEFKSNVDLIKSKLSDNNFLYEKIEVEFAIYDTNISHDFEWINGRVAES